jgi:hypothetical protein
MMLQIGDKFVVTVLLQHKDGSFQKRKTYWKVVKFGNHHEVMMARLVPVQNGHQFLEMVEECCFPSRFFESREPFKMFRLGWVFDLFGLDRQNCAGEFIDTLYEVRSVR